MKSSPYYGDPETEDTTQSEGDGGSQDSADTGNDESNESGEEDGTKDDDSETFLSPKSVAGDVSPGDKMTFECVSVYDDEVEWKPVKADSKPSKPSKMSASDEIDAMAATK